MNGSDSRSGRDARLLALVIIVSLAVLLVLARFRFPPAEVGAPPAAPATTGPLERLTARTTYDDLAASVATVVLRVSGAGTVLTVQVNAIPEPEKPGAKGKPGEPPPIVPPQLVPALRLPSDLAVVHVPPGWQVTSILGVSEPPNIAASDPRREIVVLRMPPSPDAPNGIANSVETFSGFSFVAVVEAAMGGLSATPAFVGRADLATDGIWLNPVRVLGGTVQVPIGSLVFNLDSRFVGLTVPGPGGGRALVPPAALEATVAALLSAAKGDSR
jgi:hypothetical protein